MRPNCYLQSSKSSCKSTKYRGISENQETQGVTRGLCHGGSRAGWGPPGSRWVVVAKEEGAAPAPPESGPTYPPSWDGPGGGADGKGRSI